MSGASPAGVLICGAYGTGKSTVAEEIAMRLEAGGVPLAAIDLDRLMWFETGTGDEAAAERLGLENVADVVENDLAAGIRRFVFAGWFAARPELDGFRAVVPFPLKVVGLTAPWATIERRLRSSPTAERLDDLEQARTQVRSPGRTESGRHDRRRPSGRRGGRRHPSAAALGTLGPIRPVPDLRQESGRTPGIWEASMRRSLW